MFGYLIETIAFFVRCYYAIEDWKRSVENEANY